MITGWLILENLNFPIGIWSFSTTNLPIIEHCKSLKLVALSHYNWPFNKRNYCTLYGEALVIQTKHGGKVIWMIIKSLIYGYTVVQLYAVTESENLHTVVQ